jgi:hypothetical protein
MFVAKFRIHPMRICSFDFLGELMDHLAVVIVH